MAHRFALVLISFLFASLTFTQGIGQTTPLKEYIPYEGPALDLENATPASAGKSKAGIWGPSTNWLALNVNGNEYDSGNLVIAWGSSSDTTLVGYWGGRPAGAAHLPSNPH